MNVGDIFVSIRGDGTKLPKDAVDASTKAGDEAGKSFSTRFGAAARIGFTAAAATAGAVFVGLGALANQGATAMATFRAETGATVEEAEAALDAMNRLSADNLQSFDTVAKTLTTVRTQMGLTGDDAERMAAKILKFSTATGQDATEAVSAFDDASDAWNLTTDETLALMDALIVSHQKYGGTVAESEALLNQLAPSLKAANMSWEDAVGLLNLFNHAGVGAEAAATGINRALGKVKSPEELQKLLSDIGAIEDPFIRAQKAADLFGARAGPKLANALADSHGDLATFKVDMADAAGAVDEAASAIEDTLPNKIKLAVSGALSSLRGLGTDLGPALTGSAALVSLGSSFASALRLDKAIAGAFKSAAAAPLVSSAISTAGKLMGGKLATAVGLGIAAVAVGILVDVWTKALTDANEKIRNDPANVEILKGIGGRAPIWAEVRRQAAAEAQAVGEHALKAFNAGWDEAIRRDPGDWKTALAKAIEAADLADVLRHMWSAIPPIDVAVPVNVTPVAGTGGALTSFFPPDGGPMLRTAQDELTDRLTHMWSAVGLAVSANVMSHPTPTPVAQMPDQVADEAPAAAAGISDVLRHMWSAVTTAPSRLLGVHSGEQFIVGFKSTRDAAKTEWQQYLDDLAHPNRGKRTVGWIVGKLTGEDLAKGLASSDPIVRRSAEQEQENLRVELQALIDAGYTIGAKTLAKLGLGIKDGKLVAIAEAKDAIADVKSPLDNTAGVYDWGHAIGANWVRGIADAITAGVRAGHLNDALVRVNNRMQVSSPSPKEGPLHGLERGGYAIGRSWRDELARGIAERPIDSALSRIGFGGPTFTTAATLGVSGRATVRHEFGPLTINAPHMSAEAAGALGRGIGSALGLDTIVSGFDRVLTSNG